MRVRRTCSVFFLLAGENSMRDLAGVLYYHILTFLKKKRGTLCPIGFVTLWYCSNEQFRTAH